MLTVQSALSETSALGRPRMSRAQEKQIARALSPDVAWPTLALAILLPSVFVALVVAGVAGGLPLWACIPLLSLVSYAHYSLVHEAVHGNIVSRPRSLAWINTVVGWIGAIGLGIGWPLLQRTHVLHHSHTNTPEDPDIVVKGTLVRLIGLWAKEMLPSLIPVGVLALMSSKARKQLLGLLSVPEIIYCSALTGFTLCLLAAAVVFGRVPEWLCLWFLPQQVAVLLLMIFFQWLPHHPFDRFDRYGATRISLWPGGKLLLLQQNLHLMHHLWPSVPFFNYGKLFKALRPVLEAEGSRIEGLWLGSSPPSRVS